MFPQGSSGSSMVRVLQLCSREFSRHLENSNDGTTVEKPPLNVVLNYHPLKACIVILKVRKVAMKRSILSHLSFSSTVSNNQHGSFTRKSLPMQSYCYVTFNDFFKTVLSGDPS